MNYIDAPNLFIDANGTSIAYRDVGTNNGVPLVMLNHWGAVLDNFDPRIVDRLSVSRRVVALNYRGIGLSGGLAPKTIGEMAEDAIATVRALGITKVDLMGFSLGGFVAQDITLKAPELVRKLILTGTGPAGGEGIAKVGRVSWPLIFKGLATFRDPKFYLFFTSTAQGRGAAKDFLKRLQERKANRDKSPSPRAFLRQRDAIHARGRQAPQDLSAIKIPVLIANGDQDVMVPTRNTHDLARRITGAKLTIYNDAGHGGIFQNHADFVAKASAFLGQE